MRLPWAKLGLASLLVAAVLAGAAPISAAAPAVTSKAITWTVSHPAKTITVHVQLEIYSGCSGDPAGSGSSACVGSGSQVTQFLASQIKRQIEDVWKGLKYRCYKLIFDVDVKVGSDADHVSADRVGVRIDPSATGIRSYVMPRSLVEIVGSWLRRGSQAWRSDSPADRINPQTGPGSTSSWSEQPRIQVDGKFVQDTKTWAHEFGHVIGLDDAYHDVTGPDGQTISVPNDGAPLDLMSTLEGKLSQETVDRLIKRNQNDLRDGAGNTVKLTDLKCDYRLDVNIVMTGRKLSKDPKTRAFQAKIVAEGTIDLKDLGESPGTQGGQPVTHEGKGNLAYIVTPLGTRPCTFSYEGGGGFPIGVRASIPPLPSDPHDTSWVKSIVVTLRPKLDGLDSDTLIARPCGRGKVVRRKVVPLFTLWYTDRLDTEWRVVDWVPLLGGAPNRASGEYTGHCAENTCVEADEFVLSPVP